MTAQDIEALIDRSYLSRVPDLMRAGLAYEDALAQARKDDETMFERYHDFHHGGGHCSGFREPVLEARHRIMGRVYRRAREQTPAGMLLPGNEALR